MAGQIGVHFAHPVIVRGGRTVAAGGVGHLLPVPDDGRVLPPAGRPATLKRMTSVVERLSVDTPVFSVEFFP
ncbi:MAG: hypothetical protein ACRDSE_14780, partial [Pseudonocardiaceae bacterium]